MPDSNGWRVSVQPPELAHEDFFIDVGGSMSDTPSHPPATGQPLDEMSRPRAHRSLASFWSELRGLYCRQRDLRSQWLNYWRG